MGLARLGGVRGCGVGAGILLLQSWPAADAAVCVFSIVWQENKIEWLVDDEVYFEFDRPDVGGQPYPFNDNFFFIFNVAVGGDLPGSPDETTVFPQRMIVDYVRVFK